ncbi:MAG: UvrD-helicase domain-containing protein [Acidiferrobacteraceae bacterium]
MTEALHSVTPHLNFTVEASAGTGKTWLLTSRIIRLLLQGATPGSILAITFTRKAAAEIRERIEQRLLEMALADDPALIASLAQLGLEDPDSAILQRARGLYETFLTAEHGARISTIHAFCQDILRRFPLESRLPPAFQVVETPTEAQEAAWSSLMRELSRLPEEHPLSRSFDHLLQWLASSSAVREALVSFVELRGDWWAFTEESGDPAVWATSVLGEQLQETGSLPDEQSLRDDLSQYADLIGRHPPATYQQRAQLLQQALENASDGVDTWLAATTSVFRTKDGGRRALKASAALEKSVGAAGMVRLLQLHGQLGDAMDLWIDLQRRSQNLERNRAWYTCGQDLLARFQEAKLQRGQLDFTDLEWQTYLLLNRSRHAEWVQYKLDQRIDHLLIDEFQDTNPVQWHLLLPLLEELAAGNPERPRSVFLVGDTKQSIYRFRRAQPELFNQARTWMQSTIEAHDATQIRSRRSSPVIMEFVNLIFAHSKDQDEVHPYPLPDFARHDTHHEDLWGRVEVLPLTEPRRTNTDSDSGEFRDPLLRPRKTPEDPDTAEGEQITAIIREILHQPVSVNGSVRPADYSDFLILVRNRTHVGRIEQQLRDASIPYSGAARTPLAQLPEVADILNLLGVLMSPMDNVALASALRSPVFDCAEGDLMELARLPEPCWWHRLRELVHDSPRSKDRLVRAYRLLDSWRLLVDRIPVHDLLDRIYTDTNLVQRYLHAAPPHYRNRLSASLNQVLDLALELDGGRYPGLSRFIRSLARSSSSPAPVDPKGRQSGQVRVMTIHGAKGLEAPVVILADAARVASEPGGRRTRPVVAWPAGVRRPSALLIAGREDERDDYTRKTLHRLSREQQREEANLLYVALTRARQYLFVTGTRPGTSDLGWYGHISRRLQRAGSTSGRSVPNLQIDTKQEQDADGALAHFILDFGAPPQSVQPAATAQTEPKPVDARLGHPLSTARADDFINPSASIAATEFDFPREEALTSPQAGQSARERGILIHSALEILGDIADRDDAQNQWRLGSAGIPAAILDSCWAEAASVIDDEALGKFFDPSTYQWARNELPILYRDRERTVSGVVDRLVASDQTIWLLDYKTHSHATADTAPVIARNYAAQLRLYAKGVSRLWPKYEVRPAVLFTACRILVPVEMDSNGG